MRSWVLEMEFIIILNIHGTFEGIEAFIGVGFDRDTKIFLGLGIDLNLESGLGLECDNMESAHI